MKGSSIWVSFKTKVEDLFVTGYKLPKTYHIEAIESIEGKLIDWKAKTTLKKTLSKSVQGVKGQEVKAQEVKGQKESAKNRSRRSHDSELPEEKPSEAKKRRLTSPKKHAKPDSRSAATKARPKRQTPSKYRRLQQEEDIISEDGNVSDWADNREVDLEAVKPETTEIQREPVSEHDRAAPELTKPEEKEPKESKATRAGLKLEALKDAGSKGPKRAGLKETKKLKEDDAQKNVVVKEEFPESEATENVNKLTDASFPRKCDLCFKIFTSRSGYLYHEKKHKERESPCDYCPYIGINNQQLYNHIEEVHAGNADAAVSIDEYTKKRRRRSKKTKEKFPCTQCNKVFRQKRNLESHLSFHENGCFQCPECPKTFQTQTGYDTHLNLHGGVKVLHCDQCGYVSGNRSMLNAHVRRVHEQRRSHLCDLCGRGFITSYGLNRHREATHLLEQFKDRYSCPHCSHKTHSEAGLKNHIRNIHTASQGFMCNICGMVVKYKHSLATHQKRHYNHKIYKCSACNFLGVCESDVRNHIRRKHLNVRHKCETCGKVFSQKGHLRRHMVIHTGEKQYSCSLCHYRCNVKGNLRKHMVNTHKLNQRIRPAITKFEVEQIVNNASTSSNVGGENVSEDATERKYHPNKATLSEHEVIQGQSEVIQGHHDGSIDVHNIDPETMQINLTSVASDKAEVKTVGVNGSQFKVFHLTPDRDISVPTTHQGGGDAEAVSSNQRSTEIAVYPGEHDDPHSRADNPHVQNVSNHAEVTVYHCETDNPNVQRHTEVTVYHGETDNPNVSNHQETVAANVVEDGIVTTLEGLHQIQIPINHTVNQQIQYWSDYKQ